MFRVVADDSSHADLAVGLDEIVRQGARRMLAAALEAKVEACIAGHAGARERPPAAGATSTAPTWPTSSGPARSSTRECWSSGRKGPPRRSQRHQSGRRHPQLLTIPGQKTPDGQRRGTRCELLSRVS